MRAHWLGLFSLFFAAVGCEPSISYGRINPDLSGVVTIDGLPAAGVTVTATVHGQTFHAQTGPAGAYAFGQIPFGTVTC